MPKFTDIQNRLITEHNIIIDTNSHCWSRTHAHVKERRICKWNRANSIRSTFTLAHEIGHVMTHKSTMRRCESEYYATRWAIDKLESMGVDIPLDILQRYQNYIDRELDRGLRRGGKHYPSFDEMKIAEGVTRRYSL